MGNEIRNCGRRENNERKEGGMSGKGEWEVGF